MKVSMSWSSGKDAALSLYHVLQQAELEVVSLHTTISQEHKRVGMHGTPLQLVEQQATAVGLPLEVIELPADTTNDSYEKVMLHYYRQLKARGVEAVVFGDIFLEDLRKYREQLLERAELKAIFPLWNKPTKSLADQLTAAGFEAVVCAADALFFTAEDVGKLYNKAFVEDLPEECDPCGERGEFHTFVFDAPYFSSPINYSLGQRLHKTYSLGGNKEESNGMWFMELLPAR